jgi:DNA-directed RNA polymerase subunit RPC12/RpoP
MKIKASCPQCGFKMRGGKKELGKEIPCPQCGHEILMLPRTGLKEVDLGLYFHHAAMLVGLVGGAVFVFGLALMLIAQAAVWDEQAENAGLAIQCVGCVLLLVAGAIDMPTPCLSFNLPDTTARALLAASFPVRLAVFALGVLFLLSIGSPVILLTGIVILALVAWILWVSFVHRLALYFRRPEIAREAVSVLGSAFWTLLPTVLLLGLLLLVIAIMTGISSPLGRGLLLSMLASLLGVLIRAFTLGVSNNPLVESPFAALLYPTGIPFYLKYAALLSSLRLLIRRQ